MRQRYGAIFRVNLSSEPVWILPKISFFWGRYHGSSHMSRLIRKRGEFAFLMAGQNPTKYLMTPHWRFVPAQDWSLSPAARMLGSAR